MYYVALLRLKSHALPAMRRVASTVQSDTKRGVVQCTFDRGGEFLNADVRGYVRDELQATTFYSNVESPWENGLAERSFGLLFATARAMLHDADCPFHLWGYAIQHAAVVRNHLPTRRFGGMSPLHRLYGTPADVSKLRVFGCPAMVHIRAKDRIPHPKLHPRSLHGIFVGLSDVGNGWVI